MIDLLHNQQLINAFIAGMVVGIFTPLIGVFTVLRRLSLMADTLAHIALAGVAIGLVVGSLPNLLAFVVTVLAAVFIEYLREYRKVSGDAALAMLLYGGLAVAVTIFSFAGQEVNEDLLFGSIEAVKSTDLGFIALVGGLVIVAVALFWKELAYTSFDEETARVQGVPVRFINMLLVILTAVTVSFALRIVGVLLVGALMVIPVLAATQIARSFRRTAFLSVFFSLLAVIVGLVCSSLWHLQAGGAIVIIAIICFFLTLFVRRFRLV